MGGSCWWLPSLWQKPAPRSRQETPPSILTALQVVVTAETAIATWSYAGEHASDLFYPRGRRWRVNRGAPWRSHDHREGILHLQIWGQAPPHPFTAQDPRTYRFGASRGFPQRRFDRHVAFGPQQASELGHLVLFGLTAPSQR